MFPSVIKRFSWGAVGLASSARALSLSLPPSDDDEDDDCVSARSSRVLLNLTGKSNER